jgi:transcriptional regulator with XRE-family HTH domain
MAERNEAIVKPELLIWARESSGMPISMAATKCKLAEDRLQQYECGELRPTVRQLETMADVYKRPLAVFFMSKPPGSPIPQHRLVLSSSGCLFPRIVMNSYDNKKITGADVSEYLSVKVKHFDQIKEALHNKAIHFDEI